MQQQRIDTLAFARGLVAAGVRWRHRGRGGLRGFNCAQPVRRRAEYRR
ncbi:hypothetical protein ACJJH9_12235 [Microbulbifer sp. DLAB2-AF]